MGTPKPPAHDQPRCPLPPNSPHAYSVGPSKPSGRSPRPARSRERNPIQTQTQTQTTSPRLTKLPPPQSGIRVKCLGPSKLTVSSLRAQESLGPLPPQGYLRVVGGKGVGGMGDPQNPPPPANRGGPPPRIAPTYNSPGLRNHPGVARGPPDRSELQWQGGLGSGFGRGGPRSIAPDGQARVGGPGDRRAGPRGQPTWPTPPWSTHGRTGAWRVGPPSWARGRTPGLAVPGRARRGRPNAGKGAALQGGAS